MKWSSVMYLKQLWFWYGMSLKGKCIYTHWKDGEKNNGLISVSFYFFWSQPKYIYPLSQYNSEADEGIRESFLWVSLQSNW